MEDYSGYFESYFETYFDQAFSPVVMGVSLGLAIFYLIAGWRVYSKAGKPGWAVLIPIYNVFVMLDIVNRPGWWFLLMLIPGVNVVIGIIIAIDLAKAFGKGTGFAVGLILLSPIFYPILAFGQATYSEPQR